MISNQILDFYDDQPKAIFKKIASKIPREVLESPITPIDSRSEKSQHALQILTKEGSVLNKFPINTSADTVLSALYFDETKDRIPQEAQRIAASFLKTACEKFSIKVNGNIEKLASDKYTSNIYDENRHSFKSNFEKKANVVYDNSRPESDSKSFYALPSMKKYAMPNPEYVKKAEKYFAENHKLFNLKDRIEYSVNLLGRATELNTDVELDLIHKYASNQYSKHALQALRARDSFCKTAVQKNVLQKMATFIAKTPAREFAEAVALFDKKAGIDRFYDSKIQDPYLSLLAGKPMDKIASYSYVEKYSGAALSSKQLTTAFEKKSAKISEYLGSSLANGLKKEGIAAFEALPDDTKDLVAKIAVGAI